MGMYPVKYPEKYISDGKSLFAAMWEAIKMK